MQPTTSTSSTAKRESRPKRPPLSSVVNPHRSPDRHILCLHFPHWPITRRFRRCRQQLSQPIVVATIGQRREVVDLSPAAAKKGIRIGLPLAEARALCSGLLILENDPAADAKALEALGRWMMRFTPVIATGWNEEGEEGGIGRRDRQSPTRSIAHEACLPVLFLDLTGCERLAGGIGGIARNVKQSIQRFGIPAISALAPTPGAAWALCSVPAVKSNTARRQGECNGDDFFGMSRVPGDGRQAAIQSALSPLPVASLRLSDDLLEILHHLGLYTIGQLLRVPRKELHDRFGPALILRLDQAFGRRPELLVPLQYEPPIEAAVEFDGVVESLEALWFVLQKLLDRIVIALCRRGRGARQIDLACKSTHSSWKNSQVRSVRLSCPSHDARRILRLLHCATEDLETDQGVWAMRLTVPVHEPVSNEQALLMEGESYAGHRELDQLVDGLSIRIGESTIEKPASSRRLPIPIEETVVESPRTRPLHLLRQPKEIGVVAEPSDNFEGKPRQFAHDGVVHQLVHVTGPECIDKRGTVGITRHYYDVEDMAGERFWICRLIAREFPGDGHQKLFSRWFLHGFF